MNMQNLYPAPILSLLDKPFTKVYYGLTKQVDRVTAGQTVGVLFTLENARDPHRGERYPATFFKAEREFLLSELVAVIKTIEHPSIAGVLAKVLSTTNTFGSLLPLEGIGQPDLGFVLFFDHDKKLMDNIRWLPYGEKLTAWIGNAPVEDAVFEVVTKEVKPIPSPEDVPDATV